MADLRHATPDDAAEIARLSAQLGYPTAPAEIAARLQRMSSLPAHAVLVAGDDRRLHGFAAIEHRLMLETGERVELTALCVDADLRRAGVGRTLVAAAEAWARGRGVDALFLRSNVLRPESHPFYESLGYARIKTQHAYLKQL